MISGGQQDVPTTVTEDDTNDCCYDRDDQIDHLLDILFGIVGCIAREGDLGVCQSNKEKQDSGTYPGSEKMCNSITSRWLEKNIKLHFDAWRSLQTRTCTTQKC